MAAKPKKKRKQTPKLREKARLKNQMRTRPIIVEGKNATKTWVNLINKAIKEFWPVILHQLDPKLRNCIQVACTPFSVPRPTNAQKAALLALARPDAHLQAAIRQLEFDITASTDNKDPTRWIEFGYEVGEKRDRAVIKLYAHQLEKLNTYWYSLPEPTIDGRKLGLKLAISKHVIERLTARFLENDHISSSLWWLTELILLSTPDHDRYHIIHPIYQAHSLADSIADSLSNYPTPVRPYTKIGSFIIPPNDNKFPRHLTCRTYLIPTSRTSQGTKSRKVTTNTGFSEIFVSPSNLHNCDESMAVIDDKGFLYNVIENTEYEGPCDENECYVSLVPTDIKPGVIL